MTSKLTIEGHEARLQPISGADIEALLPLVARFGELSELPDPIEDVLPALPEILTALAQLSAVPREVIARLHIAALLDFVCAYAPPWMAVNGPYLANEVAPAAQKISAHLVELAGVAEQARQRTTPAPGT